MHQYGIKFITFSLLKRLKNGLLAATLLGLVAMNITTLISDSFHTAAYAALGTALGYTLGSKLADKMLSRSSTVNRTNDVASATKELARQNKSLKKQSANLQKKIDKSSVALKKFSKRAATRSAVAATRNLTSMSGEAIPILGVAVIAGVTAWNIHDSCQMMKELDELNAEFELQMHLEEKQTVCGIEVPTKEQILAEVRENWFKAYEKSRVAINHAVDEIPDIPEIPELSSSIKRSWTVLQEAIEKFITNIPDFFKR